MPLPDAAVAALCVAAGGLATKGLGFLFGSSERVARETTELRAELRKDLVEARAVIKELQAAEASLRHEIATWQQQYYEMRAAVATKDAKIELLLVEVEGLREDVKRCHEQHEGQG